MDIITDQPVPWLDILEVYSIPYSINKITKHKIILVMIEKPLTPFGNKHNLLFIPEREGVREREGFITVNKIEDIIAFYKVVSNNDILIESKEIVFDSSDISSEIALFKKFRKLESELKPFVSKEEKVVNFIFEPIKYKVMPEKWQQNILSVERFHKVRIHTLSDLEKKLQLYPEFIEMYQVLEKCHWICKLDFLRLLLIYDEGGIYSDLDICYFNPIPDFKNLVLTKNSFAGDLNNCFIMANSKNPIIYEIMTEIKKRTQRNQPKDVFSMKEVLSLTGPYVVTDIIRKSYHYPDNLDELLSNEHITILPKFSTIKNTSMFHKYQIFCHEQDGSWLENKEKYY